MRTGLLLGTLALMMVTGAAAAVGTLRVLMSLGMKYHDNYEYYGQTPAVFLIPVVGVVGFTIPGLVVWRLHKNHWRVSLRALIVATTLIAVLFGVLAFWVRMSMP